MASSSRSATALNTGSASGIGNSSSLSATPNKNKTTHPARWVWKECEIQQYYLSQDQTLQDQAAVLQRILAVALSQTTRPDAHAVRVQDRYPLLAPTPQLPRH